MKAKNDKVIEKAFARLMASETEIIRRGMCSLLEDAVKQALALHDDRHRIHVVIGDTYGWALVHNGNIERLEVTSLPENEGNATEQLNKKASSINGNGWYGIVMAGMKPQYYVIKYEKEILGSTIRFTKDNFQQYFKKI